MRRAVWGVVWLVVLCSASVRVGSAETNLWPSSIYGHWVVKRLIPTSNVQAGPQDLDPLIATKIFYSASEARLGNQQPVKNPKYKVRRVSADDFYSDTKIALREIGIHAQSVIEIDLVDAQGRDVPVRGPGTSLFVRNRNDLVTLWDGGCFEMIRTQ